MTDCPFFPTIKASKVNQSERDKMSTEQNKALVSRLLSNTFKNLSIADEILDPNYVNYDFPAPAPGIEGWKMVNQMFISAFGDLQVVIEDEIAEGNKVVSRGYFTGTHKDTFMGIPATGKHFTIKYIDIWTVVDGKLKENWVQMDMLGLLQQLGAIPAQV